MRYVYLTFGFLVVMVLSWAGLRGSPFTKPPIEVFDDMDRQAKYKSQAPSEFFADGRADRPVVPNTVNRGVGFGSQTPLARAADGSLQASELPTWTGDLVAFNTGKTGDGAWAKGFPAPFVVSRETMARGKERFAIYCAVCHGQNGDGNGITKTYGMTATPSYHDKRLRDMAEGEIFNTIANGKNLMGPYGDKLDPQDRWAVILYVRALQRANNGTVDDVPAGAKKDLGL
jgi:mono/diheme cytochrome c family protein